MDSSEFTLYVDRFLNDIEQQLDELELDIDLERGDGKLEIVFDDGQKFILSRQGSMQQLWLAEPKGGWHYDLKDRSFVCDKRSTELMATLSEMITEKLSETVSLKPLSL